MQKIKLYELVKIRQALPTEGKSASISTKYKIVNFLKESEKELSFYVQEISNIITEYAAKDKEGNIKKSGEGIALDESKKAEFSEKMNELENTEVNCPDLEFTMEEADKLELSIENLMVLDRFVKKQ